MNTKDFKNNFKIIAKDYGFISKGSIFYKEFENILVILDLQKSRFSSLYYFNVKVYLKEFFDNNFTIGSHLQYGAEYDAVISTGSPNQYNKYLDLENEILDLDRLKGVGLIFEDFLIPFINIVLTKEGILDWYRKENAYCTLTLNVKKKMNIKD